MIKLSIKSKDFEFNTGLLQPKDSLYPKIWKSNKIDTTVARAKKVKADAEKVRDVLRNYSVDRVDDAQLADQLLGGGQARLNNVTDALKKAGMKDNDITEAIYEILVLQPIICAWISFVPRCFMISMKTHRRTLILFRWPLR